ncbi:MAG: DnaD domain protein [Lachnospiraceae bacterium]|nr:DnaD domain protein [Lachnospiraceae bacterium]
MGEITIYQDSYIGATIISNRFIDEYMTSANDAQLKIYLYLVRMMNAHLSTGISDLAERFNYTESDVMRALKYWEKQEILCLSFGEDGAVSGIRMKNLCAGAPQGPSVEETHAPQKVPAAVEPPKTPAPQARTQDPEGAPAGATILRMMPEAPAPEAEDPYKKVRVSAAQLRRFRDSESAKMLFVAAEAYMGRPLSTSELQSLFYIRETLGFDDDLIDYLIQYCVDLGKRDFRYIEKVAIAWHEQGIRTPEEARRSPGRYSKEIYEIMNRLGKSTSPTEKELEYLTKWRETFGFSREVILEACDRTVMATDSHRFQYADGILTNWHKQGLTGLEDIARADEQRRKAGERSQTESAGRGGRKPSGSFGQFQSQDVDLEELEKRIVSN